MEHSYFKDRISAFHDNELKNEERQLIAEHLQQCDECQKLLAELEKFERMVDKHSGLAGDEYWEKSARKIESAIGAETATEIVEIETSSWKGLGWKLAAVAASVAVIAFVALYEGEISERVKKGIPEPAQRITTALPVMDSTTGDKTTNEKKVSRVYDAAPTLSKETEPPREGAVGDEVTVEIEADESVMDFEKAEYAPAREGFREGAAPAEPQVDRDQADEAFREAIKKERPYSIELPDDGEWVKAPGLAHDTARAKDAYEEYLTEVEDTPDQLGSGITMEMKRAAKVIGSAPASEEEEPFDTQLVLQQWQVQRDSLHAVVVVQGQAVTSEIVKRKVAAARQMDKKQRQALVDSLSTEIASQDPQLQLLEAHYQVARFTGDSTEYEQSVQYLQDYLKQEDVPFKLHAAWYLQQLEQVRPK
ncbi:MAG: zf-HC2 domain-containing protein [Candidatus Zixiibacteriota bacterium]|nr:MAG: zf-HC2 domain-containing protein [candidate division Zixibacteria bacterium]